MRRHAGLTRHRLLGLGIAAVVAALDLWTKRYASVHFVDSPVVVIPGLITFTYTENPGGAFSIFPNGGQVIGVLALAVTVYIILALKEERARFEVIGLGLVIGGAGGNLADRLFRADGVLDGSVIDWIDMWVIPTFNIADASVSFAAAWLLVGTWMTRSS